MLSNFIASDYATSLFSKYGCFTNSILNKTSFLNMYSSLDIVILLHAVNFTKYAIENQRCTTEKWSIIQRDV